MQQNIHPKWYSDAQVLCACGNTFQVGSTKPTIKVEICAKCHPFFTGTMKFVDTMGRVERFQKKIKTGEVMATVVAAAKKKKLEKTADSKQPRTLREMLLELKH